ncbi:MAG: hypothetical protein A2748_00200 [Candidatus Wildermuthbacteria bacterium RIFCSPHIGHO2_01_FULL_45_20]|uniref:GTPase Obg n=1 Tax=Candidatus Wildermuthbacteria bacterium RIFCSPHIGHO2_02_FULL_45_25 TaxID=1802450 RepID=A0A1G2R1Q4_9BACT|nr:MAG: hypothetical protein A2748_00200 [Candidatus Wildermuthbacteria bacterium RIFCSPHIGHO2_01_FULL_45_20]OHA66001.1 MAG: hypothetical protein A3C04_03855 [Candidatus Wildermuthbacteria bacterium RIFCSPHIGHO2_02_FULL_45_25]
MLIDDITIHVISGKGGDGLVAFNKTKLSLGPTGGSGGNGGNIFFEGVTDLSALNRLRYKKVFNAEGGKKGRPQLNDGTTGKELIIQVPVGTIVHNLNTGTAHEIVTSRERYLIARGGRGGKGNFHFRGPQNTSPKQFEQGRLGEEFDIRLELKLIADVGIIGLPNSGKSSLLNALTKAQSKVADYPFTTLEPHLGVYYGVILTDIPGLIEGASTGKGLGIKFLRHIERTKILFHLVSGDSSDIAKDYQTIRNELGSYSEALLAKEEFVFLTKSDILSPDEIKAKLLELQKLNPNAMAISIHEPLSLNQVAYLLNNIQQEK